MKSKVISKHYRLTSQQNLPPEPDIQPSYSPVAQHGWSADSNHEQDDEQLIENEEDVPQEPFMRASKAVSIG